MISLVVVVGSAVAGGVVLVARRAVIRRRGERCVGGLVHELARSDYQGIAGDAGVKAGEW